ncbi:FtsX-like permease family protein [Microcella sp.]|uniref:FtsX-like permease family protein n=1 Tax=Microcella sp. TaxID=1913979 RepID=UPI0025692D22|nr:FtsX-like permease family protein [Microcella sp.]MBX9471669.1 FtsX-like permease family protein [Microcella sp.]
MTRSHVGAVGLLQRHLVGGGAVSVLLPVLVLISVLSIALAPRALSQVSTAELQHQLTRASPLILDFVGTGRLGVPFQESRLGVDYLTGSTQSSMQALRDTLPQPLLDATAPTNWIVQTPVDPASLSAPVDARPRADEVTLSLTIDLQWQQRVTVIAGALPTGWNGPDALDPDTSVRTTAPIEVAISKASAAAIGVGVGDVVGFTPAPLTIAAIYVPRDLADDYWVHTAELAVPQVLRGEQAETIVRTSVYLAPESFPALAQEFSVGSLRAWIPVNPLAITHPDADAIVEQSRQVLIRDAALNYGGVLDFRSSLPDLVESSSMRIAAMSALIALSVSGLAGVLIAVFALGVRAVLGRRDAALRLAAARGAGELQLRGAMVLESLLLSVPAALLGVAIAVVVIPDDRGLVPALLPATVALVPAVLVGALTNARPLARRRREVMTARASRARVIAELGVVGLAALALLLLSRRGLAGPSTVVGIDPLLSATPLLLAVVACLAALRLYPLVLSAMQRSVRRRGGATAVFGASRAQRDPALGFAPALALIVGVSIVVFSTVMISTVQSALVQRAAEEVGADVRVQAASIDDDTLDALLELEGVTAAVSVATTIEVPFVVGDNDRVVRVVVADTAALAAVRDDLPELPAADQRIPVVLSADRSLVESGTSAILGDASVVIVEIVDGVDLPGIGRDWILVDIESADELGVDFPAASLALLTVDDAERSADVAALALDIVDRAQPESGVATARAGDITTAAAEARTPTVEGLEIALVIAAVASLGLMLVAIVLATASVAASRNRLLGVLRVIGMSSSQLRRVQAWELGPLAGVALAVGTVLGLTLPALITSVLDLRAFVGGTAVVSAVIEPSAVLLVLAVFVAIVVVASFIALALGRRLAPAGILTMGVSS